MEEELLAMPVAYSYTISLSLSLLECYLVSTYILTSISNCVLVALATTAMSFGKFYSCFGLLDMIIIMHTKLIKVPHTKCSLKRRQKTAADFSALINSTHSTITTTTTLRASQEQH